MNNPIVKRIGLLGILSFVIVGSLYHFVKAEISNPKETNRRLTNVMTQLESLQKQDTEQLFGLEEIKARKFTLVNSEGKVIGSFGEFIAGRPALLLGTGEPDGTEISLAIDEDGPRLTLYKERLQKVWIKIDRDGKARISLIKNAEPRLALEVDDAGAQILFYNKNGKVTRTVNPE